MRIAILTLAVFCALISGWTAALAQVQDLNGGGMGHHGKPPAHHAALAKVGDSANAGDSMNAGDHDCVAAKSCSHQPKMVHPISCSACFAVVLDAVGIDRIELPASTILPALQKPMLATILKPRFPPPKTFLSFS